MKESSTVSSLRGLRAHNQRSVWRERVDIVIVFGFGVAGSVEGF